MTKINILHVAINYIRALENILHTGDAGFNSYGTTIVQSPFMPTGDQVVCGDKDKEESEMQQQPVTRPQVVTKVLRPLNNVANNVNKQPAVPVASPRNGRGLKVLHPQVPSNAGTVLHQQPVTSQQMVTRPLATMTPLTRPLATMTPVTGPQASMQQMTRPQNTMTQLTRPQMVTNMMSSSKNLDEETFSGSEDSGIAEDRMDLDCPDWTELTSTLEFPKRGSLDTMLTPSSATVTNVTSSSRVVVARQVSFPELDSDPGADLFGDMILCGEDDEKSGGGVVKGLDMGTSLFDISDNFPLTI